MKAKRHVRKLLPIDFNIRINEIIQRLARLWRVQAQVAAHAELHPVHVMRAEKVVAPFRVLPGFGNVHGNPAFAVDIEIGPAMVPGDLAGASFGRQREPNFEASRNALRSRHGDEQGMEVSAIAFLGIAGVENVAVAPSGPGFVVAHGGEDVVVDGAGFIERLSLAFSDFDRQIRMAVR